jgi:hypothetical protein
MTSLLEQKMKRYQNLNNVLTELGVGVLNQPRKKQMVTQQFDDKPISSITV